jgi:hypothetical protein
MMPGLSKFPQFGLKGWISGNTAAEEDAIVPVSDWSLHHILQMLLTDQ